LYTHVGGVGRTPSGLAQPPDFVLAPQLLAKFRTQVKVSGNCWICVRVCG